MNADYSTILVVDNAEFIRMVVRLRLQAAGVPPKMIFEARDGEQAYDLIEDKKIKNILSDYEMDPMDGISLAAKLLNEEKRKDIRFVLFSGTPADRVHEAITKAKVEIPFITKTKIRESWSETRLLNKYFPELSQRYSL